MNLVVFPHAGSGSSFYNEWKKEFGEFFSVSVIQYPAREQKRALTMPSTIKELAKDIFEQNINIFSSDYLIWGHSFGSTVAYEVNKLVYSKLNRSASVFFSSGASAPCDEHLQFTHEILNDRSVLVKTLQRIGGVPNELYSNKEFMDYFLPIIYTDIRLLMDYRDEKFEKIQCPLVLLEGTEDQVILENWERYAEKKYLKFFEGGHFFFHQNPENFKNQILMELYKHNL